MKELVSEREEWKKAEQGTEYCFRPSVFSATNAQVLDCLQEMLGLLH
jgi:hypothetical protein